MESWGAELSHELLPPWRYVVSVIRRISVTQYISVTALEHERGSEQELTPVWVGEGMFSELSLSRTDFENAELKSYQYFW